MKSFGDDKIDIGTESVRNEVFQVCTCHQTDWPVEFNNMSMLKRTYIP